MGERLKDRVAIVTGAGSVGEGWGNGKAAAALYAREGARVMCVDRDLAAAQQTVALIEAEGLTKGSMRLIGEGVFYGPAGD